MEYNPQESDEILRIFKEESEEIIQQLNDSFLVLEKNPQDKTPLKRLLQLSHSLKSAARMIGFNSIQDISHKLEDILSYWRKESIEINISFFEEIYKVCDYINELINKSVEQKADYIDEDVMLFINSLDKFIDTNNIVEEKIVGSKLGSFVSAKSIDINAIILEIMFALDKDTNETLEDIIEIVSDNIVQLKEIFFQTEYTQIKDKISDFQNYIITNDANNINLPICKAKILDIKNDIYNIYKELNLTNIEEQNNTNTEIKSEKLIPAKIDSNIALRVDTIITLLPRIKNEKDFIAELNKSIQKIIEINSSEKLTKILSLTAKLLSLATEKNAIISNEYYLTILQSLYLAKRICANEEKNFETNILSLEQRIKIAEDMLIENVENSSNPPVEIIKLSESSNFAQLQKSMKNIDLQEIKTLRVDSEKINNLISRTSELLISGLKTREHINELFKINSKINEFNIKNKNALNYLKYLEKKGFFNKKNDENTYAFYKKTQSFFTENSELIKNINNDLNNLYNAISQDDNQIHQTISEVEEIAKGIRVLPLATIFHTFPRMIRDIAKEKNKEIDFFVSGSDTTVDKKIIEEIKMPLIHILRNAVSHGIEAPDIRLKNEKNPVGTIKLSAQQTESNLTITIVDDGYGINLIKVKQKAIDKGLLTVEEANSMSNDDIIKILFLPGFSTDEEVSDISGRGIGLDVVKTKIANLNGEIYIDSILNKGCSITIKIPLSMSTIKTFLIKLNNQNYAIPINSIKYVLKTEKEKIFSKNGCDCILHEGHSVPIYNLANIFENNVDTCPNNDLLTVVILEHHEKIIAYIVDELAGDCEIFQKKLVPPILKIKNISGFTTLSTGEICLIINTSELIQDTLAHKQTSVTSSQQLALEEKIKKISDKKIVILNTDARFEKLKTDLLNYCENINIFNNVNSIYDYIAENKTDVIICKIDSTSDEIMRLIRFIKADENYINIKWVIFSDLTQLELDSHLQEHKYNLYTNFSKYQKEAFACKLANIL